jgi:PadR family transcriptional regulator, regulatory protein PadR
MHDTSTPPGFSRDSFENWTVQMRKGVLDLCILQAVSAREWYGYELVKALVAVPGVGVAEGSIYPLLSRLKRQGLVTTRLEESNEGPARKYYKATREGRELAEEMAAYFAEMTRGVIGLANFTASSSEPPVERVESEPLTIQSQATPTQP